MHAQHKVRLGLVSDVWLLEEIWREGFEPETVRVPPDFLDFTENWHRLRQCLNRPQQLILRPYGVLKCFSFKGGRDRFTNQKTKKLQNYFYNWTCIWQKRKLTFWPLHRLGCWGVGQSLELPFAANLRRKVWKSSSICCETIIVVVVVVVVKFWEMSQKSPFFWKKYHGSL